jgi:hypothetical protein
MCIIFQSLISNGVMLHHDEKFVFVNKIDLLLSQDLYSNRIIMKGVSRLSSLLRRRAAHVHSKTDLAVDSVVRSNTSVSVNNANILDAKYDEVEDVDSEDSDVIDTEDIQHQVYGSELQVDLNVEKQLECADDKCADSIVESQSRNAVSNYDLRDLLERVFESSDLDNMYYLKVAHDVLIVCIVVLLTSILVSELFG